MAQISFEVNDEDKRQLNSILEFNGIKQKDFFQDMIKEFIHAEVGQIGARISKNTSKNLRTTKSTKNTGRVKEPKLTKRKNKEWGFRGTY